LKELYAGGVIVQDPKVSSLRAAGRL